ncbi:AraC family transcriptional regulator [Sesbania bispinosa]|nr:AraC family transcriptional regulator [Sesbania bispinosa]
MAAALSSHLLFSLNTTANGFNSDLEPNSPIGKLSRHRRRVATSPPPSGRSGSRVFFKAAPWPFTLIIRWQPSSPCRPAVASQLLPHRVRA